VELELTTLDNLTRTKELHFFVSLVGPYYTVIGRDLNTVKVDTRSYSSTSYLVVSPENEFAVTFRTVCEKIEDRFKGYRFIPFAYCQQTIEGLDIYYTHEKLNTVFHALFDSHIDLSTSNIIGEEHYKSGDWIKEVSIDEGGGWTSYPTD
jgi:hypothetical protein